MGTTVRSASTRTARGAKGPNPHTAGLLKVPAMVAPADTAAAVGGRLHVGGGGGREDSHCASSRTRLGPRTTRARRTGSRMLAESGQTPPGRGGAYSLSFSRIRDNDFTGPRCTSTVPGPSKNMHTSSSPQPPTPPPASPSRLVDERRSETAGRKGVRGSPRTDGGGVIEGPRDLLSSARGLRCWDSALPDDEVGRMGNSRSRGALSFETGCKMSSLPGARPGAWAWRAERTER
mmetsp:Transcript_52188/g.136424  ORF Transcript_52188/g.136424 Transcript_52188/m.136424 type:complete len:234 (+) Transcript_52188:566-1267(+)